MDRSTDPNLKYPDFIRGDPYLEASYDIAEFAHENEFRRTKRPYLTHVVLTSELLHKFGGTKVQQAIGLLHDVLENKESKVLYPNVETLKSDLIRQVGRKFGAHYEKAALEDFAEQVSQGVKELTNGAYYYEDKRTWQVDHVRGMDYSLRSVKILDQAATLLEDILYTDPTDVKAMRNNAAFAFKGLDVSRACKGNAKQNPMHEFYKRILLFGGECYDLAKAGKLEEAEQKRASFDLDKFIERSKTGPKKTLLKKHKVLDLCTYGKSASGLVRITMDEKTHEVISFGLVVEPRKKGSLQNEIATRMRDALENRTGSQVQTGEIENTFARLRLRERGVERHGLLTVRDFKLKPPLALGEFLQLAYDASAIGKPMRDEIRRRITLVRAFPGQGEGGPGSGRH